MCREKNLTSTAFYMSALNKFAFVYKLKKVNKSVERANENVLTWDRDLMSFNSIFLIFNSKNF